MRHGNAKQTPVYSDMPADSTINVVGDKTVHIHSCGYEKQQCRAMLTVLQMVKSFILSYLK